MLLWTYKNNGFELILHNFAELIQNISKCKSKCAFDLELLKSDRFYSIFELLMLCVVGRWLGRINSKRIDFQCFLNILTTDVALDLQKQWFGINSAQLAGAFFRA